MTPLRPTTLPLLLLTLLSAGCQSPLPTYPRTDAPESLRIIAQRLAAVKTVQSSATVDFEEISGAGVRLDAALVAQPPDMLRLRAWKFDRAVFDATLRAGELWMLPADKEQSSDRTDETAHAAEGIRRAFSLLTPAFYESAQADDAHTTTRVLVVTGDTLTCTIDRPTLTPRRFENPGAALSIELQDYRFIDSIAWPTTWIISHPRGRVVIHMHDVLLNTDLPPGAFTPPHRAVRNP